MQVTPPTTTATSLSLRKKVAVGLAAVGVLSGVAAAVVATTAVDQESARTFIWVLLAGSGLAPIALIVGRLG